MIQDKALDEYLAKGLFSWTGPWSCDWYTEPYPKKLEAEDFLNNAHARMFMETLNFPSTVDAAFVRRARGYATTLNAACARGEALTPNKIRRVAGIVLPDEPAKFQKIKKWMWLLNNEYRGKFLYLSESYLKSAKFKSWLKEGGNVELNEKAPMICWELPLYAAIQADVFPKAELADDYDTVTGIFRQLEHLSMMRRLKGLEEEILGAEKRSLAAGDIICIPFTTTAGTEINPNEENAYWHVVVVTDPATPSSQSRIMHISRSYSGGMSDWALLGSVFPPENKAKSMLVLRLDT